MPMVFSQMDNYWYQNWESFTLVVFQDRKEKVIFEEAHSSVRNLEVRTGYGLDQSLEKLLNIWLELRNITDIQYLQQLLQEHSFLSEIGKWPIS
jgi:hypothetical protein